MCGPPAVRRPGLEITIPAGKEMGNNFTGNSVETGNAREFTLFFRRGWCFHSAILTSILPVLAPRSMSMNAVGAFSSPLTTVSR